VLDRLVRVVRVGLEGLQRFLRANVTAHGWLLATDTELGVEVHVARGTSASLRDAVDDGRGTKLVVAVLAHPHVELLFVLVFLIRAFVLRDLPCRRVERDFV